MIPNLINYDQAAYVKGRFIGESIQIIKDILYHADQEFYLQLIWKRQLTLWNMLSSLLNLGLVRISYSG